MKSCPNSYILPGLYSYDVNLLTFSLPILYCSAGGAVLRITSPSGFSLTKWLGFERMFVDFEKLTGGVRGAEKVFPQKNEKDDERG